MTKFRKATLDDLKKSGFNLKQIEMMQIRDIPPDELYDIFKSAYVKLGMATYQPIPRVWAYEIPYFDLEGKPTGFSRYKLLEEFISAKGKKAAKYLQPPGTKAKFYLPPFCNWAEIARDITKEIFFVEGEKKAAALTLLGAPAIGIGGVWNWKSENEIITDFNLFELTHRKIFILFDQDV